MSSRIPVNVLQAFLSSHWAMTPEAMRKCYAVIMRQGLGVDAVQRELGHRLENARTVTVRDGVAYLPVRGPMIRYGDSFDAICFGATSYEGVARDLEVAMRDSSVRAVVLNLDTPGGELSGCLDLGEQVHQADARKPIYALASGACASAGLIVAAGAREIIANPSAIVGSLGVCMAIRDRSKADADAGIEDIEIVSSQTPRKHIDPTTPDGRAELQRVVDDLADVVGAQVARHRGMDAATILADLGAGALYVGEVALRGGLVDRIEYTEDFHSRLVAELARPSASLSRPVRAATAATPAASLQLETTMKFKKGDKVRVAKGTSGPIAAGTTGEVDAVAKESDAATPYRVTFAGGAVSGFVAESALVAEGEYVEETEEERKKREADEAASSAPEGTEGAPKKKEEEETPEAKAVAAERARVLGIQALAMPGEEELVASCIADPTCTVEGAALKLRQAQAKAPTDRLAARRTADAGLPRAGGAGAGAAPPAPAKSAGAARVIAAIGRVFPGKKAASTP